MAWETQTMSRRRVAEVEPRAEGPKWCQCEWGPRRSLRDGEAQWSRRGGGMEHSRQPGSPWRWWGDDWSGMGRESQVEPKVQGAIAEPIGPRWNWGLRRMRQSLGLLMPGQSWGLEAPRWIRLACLDWPCVCVCVCSVMSVKGVIHWNGHLQLLTEDLMVI